MKIIDLLNKIAKGEEVPKKFKFAGQVFEKNGSYIIDEDGDSIFESIFGDFSNINDEVEIIEEEKEIEKLNDYFRGEIWTNDIGQKRLDDNFDTFARKINELIDVINDMRDKE